MSRMFVQIRRLVILISFIFCLFSLQFLLRKYFSYPYPIFTEVVNLSAGKSTRYGLLDLSGLMLGMRHMTANIAWIQLLQYYGTPEVEHEHKENGCSFCEDYGAGKYYDFLALSQRVIRLDPFFHYAYLYSAGALAWNLNRPEEAILLLQEGIRSNPKYWRFRLYLGAVIYQQLKKFEQMLTLLKEAVRYPDCPSLIKVIVANIYEKQGRYIESLRIWFQVLESKDESYRLRAEKKIAELQNKARL